MSDNETKDLFPDVPECLVSPVGLERTIELWRGTAKLDCASVQREGEAQVLFSLNSPSRFNFQLTVAKDKNPFDLIDLEEEGVLRTGSVLGDLPCQVTGDFSSSSNATTVSGLICTEVSKSFPNEKFTAATYLVVNGPEYRGSPIKQGSSSYLGRMSHANDKMFVILDKVNQLAEEATHFRFSHLARFEFAVPANTEDIDRCATNLFRSLSLMKGGWVGLVGPWLDVSRGSNRIVPYATQVVRSPGHTSWYHESDQLGFGQVFNRLQAAYDDSGHCEAIQTAFHWLVESEQCAGAVEGSLILQQCVLECLAWLVVVQKRKLCSTSGFKGLPAADRIRLLLSTFDIDYSIPSKSSGIEAYAKAFTLEDLVDVLVDVRNAIVHAEPNKAQRLVRPDHERSDLWFQVGGLLQQAFLAVIGYDGNFVNRSVAADYAIQALQQVPWAESGG